MAIAAAKLRNKADGRENCLFLYGNIEEGIYVEKPNHVDDYSARVCKLKKKLCMDSNNLPECGLANVPTSLGYTLLNSDCNAFIKDGHQGSRDRVKAIRSAKRGISGCRVHIANVWGENVANQLLVPSLHEHEVETIRAVDGLYSDYAKVRRQLTTWS